MAGDGWIGDGWIGVGDDAALLMVDGGDRPGDRPGGNTSGPADVTV
ncbi:hypothetical protein [Actinomadura pelletieri]|nr:hypothetical protein [Actinomadura pelletieri]